MAIVKAQLNGLRIAPRKVRAVANLVKGKGVAEAASQLEFYVRRTSPALLKLLNSAIANAENTYHMVKDNLYIKDFIVDEGVKLKRFKPKGFGRAAPIQKKTSLIKIVLAERVAGMKRSPSADGEKAATKEREHVHDHEHVEEKAKDKKPELKTEIGKKSSGLSFAKRIFRRKQV
ncbi:MAG: 50S ribosomal protein L22 [Candidatus Yanofskybacteria bacterium]|nr:50S ribosomal protein L22 [Candidatus Yanofskybacteria bacterium]